ATYAAPILSYVVTNAVLAQLKKEGFPASYLKAMQPIVGQPFASTATFITTVEQLIVERLTVKQEQQLLAAAQRNTIGPSVTDTPIRQVVYFGDNAQDQNGTPIYGILAS